MKRKKRLSGILMIVAALIIMQLPVSEADAATSASDFKMEGSTLVKYRGTETNVSVPNTVEVIGESAFEDNDTVELIVLPNSVKRIEAYAFWGCDRLDTVVLGKGLKEVGDYSFTNCKGLKEMSIPANVRSIGIQAFADCVNLADITIPPEVTNIHETAFDGCSKLVIHCETGSVADKYAADFYEKQKEMPEYEDVPDYSGSTDSEDGMGNGADNNPDNSIGNHPDTGTGNPPQDPDTGTAAGSIPVPEITDQGGNILGTTQVVGNRAVVFIDNTSPVVLEGAQSPANVTVQGAVTEILQEAEDGSLPKYTVVDGKIVADQAYYKNTELSQITLPQGIEEIGQFAFARSTITDIVVPEGVKEISYGAFYHCDVLGSVSLPSTIENVEPKAFEHSYWVEDFLQNGPGDFLISAGTLIAYRGEEAEVTIPEGVETIAGEAFMGNVHIRSIIFPESLQVIGEGAFENCSNLAAVQTGSQLSKVKDRAFAGCPIENVKLPASVQEVGLQVFDEGTEVEYMEGRMPVTTHETSAERLSNDKYRKKADEIRGNGSETETGSANSEPGVTVTGVAPAAAQLEGAAESYVLSISSTAENSDLSVIQNAYSRCYRAQLPESAVIYDLVLTDDSKIPITKLGKQYLTVTMPVPEVLSQENIRLVTLDRNGQLENVKCERVILDGSDALRFQTTHLSLFAMYGDGTAYNAEAVEEVSAVIQNMSAGPGNNSAGTAGSGYWNLLKWSVCGVLLLWGITNLVLAGIRSGFRKNRKTGTS